MKNSGKYYEDSLGRYWIKRCINGSDLWRRVKRTPFEVFMTGRARVTPPPGAHKITVERMQILDPVVARPVMFKHLSQ